MKRTRLTAAERREVIERAATQVFAERGYQGAGMDEIARRSGVTPPVLYDHFDSKLDLHRRLLERTREELLAMWREELGGDEPAEQRVPRALDAWARYVEEHPYAARMYFQEPTGDPEARAVSLETIADETERLSRLVGDVLDLAKLDARRFTVLSEEVDMEHLMERAYATFHEEARRRGIDYRSELHAHPVLITDGDRVLQIITNLLSNAFRWTPDGGRIELGLTQDNGAVAVSVSDTGPGISMEERDRIFRPFWSRDGRGTGLGLAIAHELAQALGGRIDLESEVGRGSTFEFVLPSES